MVKGAGPVVLRLRARQAAIEDAVYARVRDAVPDPAGLADSEYVAGLRATVRAVLDYGLMGIERGDERSQPVPSVAVAQAHRGARNGVSLETVLLRYTAGYTLLGDFVIEELERSDGLAESGALRHLLRVQAALLERLTATIASEYKDELERVGRSPEQYRSELVRRLLAGAPVDLTELDYDFEAWHLALIATGPGAAQALRSLQAGLPCELLSVAQGEQTFWAWLGGQRSLRTVDLERVLFPPMRRSGHADCATGRRLPPAVSLVAGETAWGLEGWRLTHRQAQKARVVAQRKPRRLTRYADVALLATALEDELLARMLTDTYLLPLDDYGRGGPVLRETLRAYFAAERNVSSAAAALGVVRNTVKSRLRMTEQRLGRPLHSCLAELEVALRLDELDDHPPGDASPQM